MSAARPSSPNATSPFGGFLKRSWPRAAAVLLLLVGGFVLWRQVYVPRRVEELYILGEEAYLAGNMEGAIEHLERVHRLDGDNFEAMVLLGWSHWRLGRPEVAEPYFREVHEAQPDRTDVIRGLAFTLQAQGKHEEAIMLLENVGWNNPQDLEAQRILAEAYRMGGRNVLAARIYRELLNRNPGDYQAEELLLRMFGLPQIASDASLELPNRPRPAELDLRFRARGDFLQARSGGSWRSAYLTGLILGPARPGEFAVTASLDFRTYRDWLAQIGEMNAGTVRVYTILPPAFYQALAAHNAEAEEPLWLLQGVWLDDLVEDLFDAETTAAFEEEVRIAIDVIHGRADVACRPGHYCGVYTADVSPWVVGMALGRDMEPMLVRRTNAENERQTAYQGRYLSLEAGSPVEAWFARMLDLAVSYETETYNAQRPLTIVNWPALDPLEHPSEVTLEEELRLRRGLGEEVPDTLPSYSNDLDGVAVDLRGMRAEETFEAGLFALYHVFLHRPGFLFQEPRYLQVQDAEGPNPFLGYLLDLKAAHPGMPLIVGAFGVSTSIEASQLHPLGWHNGGLTETQQAELLVRLNRNVEDAGLAGGVVFEWLDEWWKRVDDPFIASLEVPRDADPIWFNRIDPEEAFGLSGFRPFSTVPLLRGNIADWREASWLYRDVGAPGTLDSPDRSQLLRGVQATSDYAYLYLRADLASTAPAEWSGRSLWFALNTLPGAAGSSRLPGPVPPLDGGANFLLQIDDLQQARLLVAENYNPWGLRAVSGRPDVERLMPKQDLAIGVDSAGFEELRVEVNPPAWTADGDYVPPVNTSWSPLARTTLGSGEAASNAGWHVDPSGTVEVRIPWSKLLVLDPSTKMVFGGSTGTALQPRATEGVSLAAFVIDRSDAGGPSLVASLPRLGQPSPDGRQRLVTPPTTFSWETWSEVLYRPYLKEAYGALRSLWGGWPRLRGVAADDEMDSGADPVPSAASVPPGR